MINKKRWLKTGKQFIRFILISGIGWIIDFSVYFFLTSKLKIHVGIANFISAIPAVTYVFFLSTRKIFANRGTLPTYIKYVIYFTYQVCLLLLVSTFSQYLYDKVSVSGFAQYQLIADHLEIMIKILITPITMTCNFVFMKTLTEKI